MFQTVPARAGNASRQDSAKKNSSGFLLKPQLSCLANLNCWPYLPWLLLLGYPQVGKSRTAASCDGDLEVRPVDVLVGLQQGCASTSPPTHCKKLRPASCKSSWSLVRAEPPRSVSGGVGGPQPMGGSVIWRHVVGSAGFDAHIGTAFHHTSYAISPSIQPAARGPWCSELCSFDKRHVTRTRQGKLAYKSDIDSAAMLCWQWLHADAVEQH